MGIQRDLKLLVPKDTANTRHSPTCSQMNMNPHTKDCLPWFLYPETTHLSFYKKYKA